MNEHKDGLDWPPALSNEWLLQSWPKLMAKTAKNGVVLDTTSNVQPI